MEAVKGRLEDELQGVPEESFRAQQVRMSLLFADQASRELTGEVEEVLAAAARDASRLAGYDVSREIGVWWKHYGYEATPPNFGAMISVDKEILVERFSESLKTYGQAVANTIKNEVALTLGTRGDRGKLTSAIQAAIGREKWRAERIARTEVQHAYNASHHATMRYAKDSGVAGEIKKTCIVTYDARTAEDSLPLEGQVRELDEMFEDGEGRRYLHPPGRPNDREKEVPWFPDDAEPGGEDPEAAKAAFEKRGDMEPIERGVQQSLIDGRISAMSADSSEGEIRRTKTGELTDGVYRVSPHGAARHAHSSDDATKSRFDEDVDAEEIALEAAQQADFTNAWKGKDSQEAWVDTGRIIGYDVETGKKTRYVRVVRRKGKKGLPPIIHAFPEEPPAP